MGHNWRQIKEEMLFNPGVPAWECSRCGGILFQPDEPQPQIGIDPLDFSTNRLFTCDELIIQKLMES